MRCFQLLIKEKIVQEEYFQREKRWELWREGGGDREKAGGRKGEGKLQAGGLQSHSVRPFSFKRKDPMLGVEEGSFESLTKLLQSGCTKDLSGNCVMRGLFVCLFISSLYRFNFFELVKNTIPLNNQVVYYGEHKIMSLAYDLFPWIK